MCVCWVGGVGLGWIWGILQRPLLILVRRNDPRDLRGLEMGFLGPECLGCGRPASVPTFSWRGLQHRDPGMAGAHSPWPRL